MIAKRQQLAVEYLDLLEVPFVECGRDAREGLDCVGLVRIVLERAGRPVGLGAFPNDYANINEAFGRVRQFIEPSVEFDFELLPWARHWREVSSDGCLPGDVAFFFDGEKSHVAVIVSRSAGREITVLTATARGVRALPLSSIKNLVGIYRLRSSGVAA